MLEFHRVPPAKLRMIFACVEIACNDLQMMDNVN